MLLIFWHVGPEKKNCGQHVMYALHFVAVVDVGVERLADKASLIVFGDGA